MSFKNKKLLVLSVFCLGFLSACKSGTTIFPDTPTSISTKDDMASPIDIVVDTTNNQLIIINSNVDFYFDNGFIMTASVNATTPSAPVLTETSLLNTPNFAGRGLLNAGSLYVSFREPLTEGGDDDQLIKYTIGAASITSGTVVETGSDPFGVTITGTSILNVCDDELRIFNTALSPVANVDLTVADTSGITDAKAKGAEDVVVDATSNRAYISNRTGKIFVVDLATNTLTHVIDGPATTRQLVTDGTYIYVLDGNPSALWVLDPSLLPAAASTPVLVDDAIVLVATISLGSSPNAIALDVANRRAYVANALDPSLSVIDLDLLREVDKISLADDDTGLGEVKDPFSVAVGTFGGTTFVFTANISSNNVSVINPALGKMVALYPN